MVQLRALLVLSMGLSIAVVASAAPQGLGFSGPRTDIRCRPQVEAPAGYVWGPDDVIAIKAMDADEINAAALRVDSNGFISLPLLGRVPAGGSSVERLEKEIATRLQKYVRSPVVAVNVVEYPEPAGICMWGASASRVFTSWKAVKRSSRSLQRRGASGRRRETPSRSRATFGVGPDTPAVGDHRPSGQFSVAQVSLQSITQATARSRTS